MQEHKLGQKWSMLITRVPGFGSVRHWSADLHLSGLWALRRRLPSLPAAQPSRVGPRRLPRSRACRRGRRLQRSPGNAQPANEKLGPLRTLPPASRKPQPSTAELHALIGKFMLATIFGTPPPAGTVAIHNEQVRGSLLRFYARTRLGWTETAVDRPKEHVGRPIEDQDVEKMRQQLKEELEAGKRQRFRLQSFLRSSCSGSSRNYW